MAQLIKLKRYALLTRNDVPLCFVQQLNWETDAAHRKQLQNEVLYVVPQNNQR